VYSAGVGLKAAGLQGRWTFRKAGLFDPPPGPIVAD